LTFFSAFIALPLLFAALLRTRYRIATLARPHRRSRAGGI
jgi:hypothetical protein